MSADNGACKSLLVIPRASASSAASYDDASERGYWLPVDAAPDDPEDLALGEIRFEILNLTNTAKFGNESTNNAINTPTFGRISTQAGFMRIWQLSFRYRF